MTASILFWITAGALIGYWVGGLWGAVIGGVLGYALLHGSQWVLDQGRRQVGFEGDGGGGATGEWD